MDIYIKLLFLFLSGSLACKSRSGKSISTHSTQSHKNDPHLPNVIHLKSDLIPRSPNNITDYEIYPIYKNTKPIKNVISELIKRSEKYLPVDRQHVHDMFVLNGSANNVYEGRGGDNGVLSVIYEAYNNHWGVKTVPDDWWYTIR